MADLKEMMDKISLLEQKVKQNENQQQKKNVNVMERLRSLEDEKEDDENDATVASSTISFMEWLKKFIRGGNLIASCLFGPITMYMSYLRDIKRDKFNGNDIASKDTSLSKKEWIQYQKMWRETISDDNNIGMFCLSYMTIYEKKSFTNYFKASLFLSVIIVQLAVPMMILQHSLTDYNDGRCPADADMKTRLLSFFVALIYIVKVTLLIETKISSSKLVTFYNTAHSNDLRPFLMLDYFMDVGYEILIYLLNLFIVFTEGGFFDLLLNALALEFIMQFDDEMKKMYHKTNQPTMETAKAYMKANGIPMPKLKDMDEDKIYARTGERVQDESVIKALSNFMFMFIANHIANIAIVLVYSSAAYLPMCKGKGGI